MPLIQVQPGNSPTNNILIKFEIQWSFVMFFFITYAADHNEIVHTSRQCNYRDMCKISLWSVERILNQSTANFDWISNSIEIALVGQAPGNDRNRTHNIT